MKKYFFPLGLLLLGCVIVAAQQKPVPPGRTELKDYQAKHVDDPPQVALPRSDLGRLRQEATSLADLAQTIPHDIDSASKGVLSKDVLDKLRRIEKMSKDLRRALAP